HESNETYDGFGPPSLPTTEQSEVSSPSAS
ncbi:MAG: hypothetical protein JWM53_3891, partial [bacterium]|nr:hypothetical protein [bacterium]